MTAMFDTQHSLKFYDANSEFEVKDVDTFTGFINGVFSNAYQIMDRMNNLDFAKDTKNRNLNFMYHNWMNDILKFYVDYKVKLSKNRDISLTEFTPFLLIFLFLYSSILCILLITSISTVIWIRKQMNQIFTTLLSRREKDFVSKIKILKIISQEIDRLKDAYFYLDCLSNRSLGEVSKEIRCESNEEFTKKLKTKRAIRSSNFHCYGLTISMILIIVYYLSQIIFTVIVSYLLNTMSQKCLYQSEKIDMMDQLMSYNLIASTSIYQFSVLGNKYQIMNKKSSLGLAELLEINQDKIVTALKYNQDSENGYSGQIEMEDYLKLSSKTSLCYYISFLRNRQELCERLEDQTPKNGMIQVLIHNIDIIKETLLLLSTNQFDYDPKKLLNDAKFLEWEYACEMIYWKAYREIQLVTIFIANKLSTEGISILVSYIENAQSIFLGVSSTLMAVALMNLYRQLKRVMFNYQLMPLKLVIENGIVKGEFLRLVRLNRNYF